MVCPKESTPLYSTSTHHGMSVFIYCLGGIRYGMGIISLQMHNTDIPNWAVCGDKHCQNRCIVTVYFVGQNRVRIAAAVNTCIKVTACRNIRSGQGKSTSEHSHQASITNNNICMHRYMLIPASVRAGARLTAISLTGPELNHGTTSVIAKWPACRNVQVLSV